MFFDKIRKKNHQKHKKHPKTQKKHQKQSLRCPGALAGRRRTDCTLGGAQPTTRQNAVCASVPCKSTRTAQTLFWCFFCVFGCFLCFWWFFCEFYQKTSVLQNFNKKSQFLPVFAKNHQKSPKITIFTSFCQNLPKLVDEWSMSGR